MYSMTYLNNHYTYCLKLQKIYFNALKIVFSVNKVANLLIMPDLITKLPGTLAERKSVIVNTFISKAVPAQRSAAKESSQKIPPCNAQKNYKKVSKFMKVQ